MLLVAGGVRESRHSSLRQSSGNLWEPSGGAGEGRGINSGAFSLPFFTVLSAMGSSGSLAWEGWPWIRYFRDCDSCP
jgi:hypothetical protein